MTENRLYYGDNLDILREHIPEESVDLIYLDPPFNSKRSYNVLFREANGTAADSQIAAFDDTWHWNETAEETLHEIEQTAEPHIVEMMQAMVGFIGRNDVSAYLVMMTIRLAELHRVLKPTGSICLHCDPTASHYLKVVMDTVFGVRHFRNEVIWRRTSAHSDAAVFGSAHDAILYYSKSDEFVHNKQYQPYSRKYVESHYRYIDEDGRRYRTDNLTATGLSGGGYEYSWNGVTKVWRRPKERMQELHDSGRIRYTRTGTAEYIRYLDEMPGVSAQDIWDDISAINSQAKERLGYPTQKPLALLERITGVADTALAERYLDTAWRAVEYIAATYADRVFLGVGMPYNRELVGLNEVEAFGRRLVGVDPGVQLCVLDYFPTFRRQDLRRPRPSEMLEVKRILEGVGLCTVVVQTAMGHVGPGWEAS